MPEIKGRGRNAYETVDAGGTFFVHLSGILLPYHKVSYIGGIHKLCGPAAQDTVSRISKNWSKWFVNVP